MISSGTTAIATNGAGAVTVIDPAGTAYNVAVIRNEGTVAGFYSIDGGTTWARLSAGAAGAPCVERWRGKSSSKIMLKRDGGSDMAGVYAWCDWQSSGRRMTTMLETVAKCAPQLAAVIRAMRVAADRIEAGDDMQRVTRKLRRELTAAMPDEIAQLLDAVGRWKKLGTQDEVRVVWVELLRLHAQLAETTAMRGIAESIQTRKG